MKILYIGPILPGSTCLQRLEALRELGHEVVAVASTDLGAYRALRHRLMLKLGVAPDLDRANQAVRKAVTRERFDVCWFDKPITVDPETLAFIRHCSGETRIVGYAPDDMLIRPNRTCRFVRCLPWFDLFFTTKNHNAAALQRLGAQRVEVVENAYSEQTHRPMPRNAEHRLALGGAIGFIGDHESERMRMIARLAREGMNVRIWGPNWSRRWRRPPPGVRIEGRSLAGDDYATAVSNFDINLAFLRKAARDEVTTRSVEIPACAGFMLAERTAAHQALFSEGEEAEFFVDEEELLRKCRFYLRHPERSRKIAEAGRARCLRDGYGNRERMRQMLRIAEAAAPEAAVP